jgi:hypothetical protein
MSAFGNKDTKSKTPFKISDDEYLIKDYHAANIKKPQKGEGHLALTNKRAIIYYWTKKGVIVNGANISEVTATDILWGTRKRRLAGIILLSAGIIGLLGFVPALISTLMNPYGFYYYSDYFAAFFSLIIPILIPIILPIIVFSILLIIGVYLIVKERFTFIVTLFIKSVTGAISLHNYPLPNQGISGFFAGLLKPSGLKIEGRPGPDAEIMAKEVGALILDIQRGAIK